MFRVCGPFYPPCWVFRELGIAGIGYSGHWVFRVVTYYLHPFELLCTASKSKIVNEIPGNGNIDFHYGKSENHLFESFTLIDSFLMLLPPNSCLTGSRVWLERVSESRFI